jgi:hypothetical protein
MIINARFMTPQVWIATSNSKQEPVLVGLSEVASDSILSAMLSGVSSLEDKALVHREKGVLEISKTFSKSLSNSFPWGVESKSNKQGGAHKLLAALREKT